LSDLISFIQEVGFVGGWSKALFGAVSLLLAGVLDAFVAAFFTFLPSSFSFWQEVRWLNRRATTSD
jgi:hypothetical protein